MRLRSVKSAHKSKPHAANVTIDTSLCMQVLSETVAKGLKFTFKEDAREAAVFVEKIDKFFDSLNVTNYTKCITTLKPFKMPYRSGDDFRMKVS